MFLMRQREKAERERYGCSDDMYESTLVSNTGAGVN